ncbi:MAG TPA: hypothetical protein VGR74_10715 [Actinomycetota bacterium]|nr:hypothetical protein [Actinomycetota bacterium]
MRRRRRERIGDPYHDGTHRHPPRPERDRVAQRDGHGTDATSPDHRCDANDCSTPDLGPAFDVPAQHGAAIYSTPDVG